MRRILIKRGINTSDDAAKMTILYLWRPSFISFWIFIRMSIGSEFPRVFVRGGKHSDVKSNAKKYRAAQAAYLSFSVYPEVQVESTLSLISFVFNMHHSLTTNRKESLQENEKPCVELSNDASGSEVLPPMDFYLACLLPFFSYKG